MRATVMFATIAGLALLGGGWSAGAQSKKEMKKVPVSSTRADSGVEMYKSYCAACHGVDGKGKGPAAEALKVPPTDLTLLNSKNGGKFPSNRVANIIGGAEGIRAHGSSDMPLWGPIFHSLDSSNESVTKLRIANVVKYLESIQQ
jgi:mono/diheme cytochrome c family protein